MPPTVAVLVGGSRVPVPPLQIGIEPPIVRATHLVVEVRNDSAIPDILTINGEQFPLIHDSDRRRGVLLLDRTRSTGYHQFDFGGARFCFGTADAKLRLDGILTILDTIRHAGLSWGHQLIFADGSAIRDPRVDFAWLRNHLRDIAELCERIADHPSTRSEDSSTFDRPRGGRVLLSRTLSRLRAEPTALLEEHPAGLLKAAGRRYMPRRVEAASLVVTHDTIGNRRATRLLLDSADLARFIAGSADVPKRAARWASTAEERLLRIAGEFPFRTLVYASERIPEEPSKEEHTDPRYSDVYDTHTELVRERGWNPGRSVSNQYAYVGHSDEIFEAFVAVLLSQAFGMEQVFPTLRRGLEEPLFTSDEWELYFDTTPPQREFSSWRDDSLRPGKLTPDYCLINTDSGVALLGDAKYRAKGGTTLPGGALKECQVYMQHFDVPSFAVFYPGKPRFMRAIEGEGNCILEVSITPFSGVDAWVEAEVRPRLEEIMHAV